MPDEIPDRPLEAVPDLPADDAPVDAPEPDAPDAPAPEPDAPAEPAADDAPPPPPPDSLPPAVRLDGVLFRPVPSAWQATRVVMNDRPLVFLMIATSDMSTGVFYDPDDARQLGNQILAQAGGGLVVAQDMPDVPPPGAPGANGLVTP